MITITDAQARELAELLREYGDGSDVRLSTTTNSDATLVIEFSLCTFTITRDGDREDA